jgi:hypothetical protein
MALSSYQKLFGLYLLATITIATLESDSMGYAPHDAFGKCSLTYAERLFSVDVLRTISSGAFHSNTAQ